MFSESLSFLPLPGVSRIREVHIASVSLRLPMTDDDFLIGRGVIGMHACHITESY